MPPKSRRRAREAALRALYQIEVGKAHLEEALRDIGEEGKLTGDLREYAEKLARGVVEHRDALEALVSERLMDWTLERLAVVDRLLLLLGAYELHHCPEVPPAVTLNEAIDLAKKYSTAESGKFVNGVLAKVLASSPKAGYRHEQGAEEPAESEPSPARPEIVLEGSAALEEVHKAGSWVIKEKPEA